MSLAVPTSSGSVKTFGDYMLTEAFVPKQTEYGSNELMNDRKTIKTINGGTVAFFEDSGMYYLVVVTVSGEVGFGTSTKKSVDAQDYTTNRISTSNALRVFNRVMYVAKEIIAQRNLRTIKFDPANAALAAMYKRMVKNKSFLDSLAAEGFEFQGQDSEGYFVFKKK